jgi:hypothetical protein
VISRTEPYAGSVFFSALSYFASRKINFENKGSLDVIFTPPAGENNAPEPYFIDDFCDFCLYASLHF